MTVDENYLTNAGDPLSRDAEAVAALLQDRLDRVLEERRVDDRRKSPDRRLSERLPLLGQLLLSHGLISEQELQQALSHQLETRERLGETVVRLGIVSSTDMARVLAEQLQVPFTDLEGNPPDVMVASLVPEEVARRYQVLAVTEWDEQLVVAMADPRHLCARRFADDHRATNRRVAG